ncbi:MULTISPECIES: NAD(P)-dependent oxidoreductase [unclassified Microcoleus]|uniref:NAD(P)-dependent oxidoreductase n=1 Tax=unclassified Microcoleus TaxID=2642155 RepID=UPI002FD72008
MEQGEGHTILLTGATGFIGAAVFKQILASGNLPIALLRPVSNASRLQGLKEYRSLTYETLQSAELVRELQKYRPKTLIHLAWHWRDATGRDSKGIYQVTDNLPLTIDSVKLAQAVGCTHWIGIGSREEYGNANCQVDESYPTMPATVYGQAKLSACWAALSLCQAYGMCGSWMRTCGVYGRHDEPSRLIPYLIKEMCLGNTPKLTKCEQIWDYLYVDDAARGILSVANAQVPGIFNLGSGMAVPLKIVVERIRELVNPQIQPEYGAINYSPGQVMNSLADITKITTLTGWQPRISLQDGLKLTVDEDRHKL